MYYKEDAINNIRFPNVATRGIGHLVRNIHPIPDYKAVVDIDTDRTFAIVKNGYKVIPHEQVLESMDLICKDFPEFGIPTKEVWMQNHGGRMRVRYTFEDVDFEIGTLKDGSPDTVHPTMESFCSYDTTIAHKTMVGGYRLVCSNGLVIGTTLGMYKKKHTDSLDIDEARGIIHTSMANYSEATDLWLSFADKEVSDLELRCYEAVGFNKNEKQNIEDAIHKEGNVIAWDKEADDLQVEMSTWSLYNILTDVLSHKVEDLRRQAKISAQVAKVFH